MQNRRDFLKHASVLLAGGLVAPQLLSSCAGGADKIIGLQLYSLREMEKEVGIQGVLEAVAKMGYKTLETAGGFSSGGKIYNTDPSELRKMANDLGMRFTSAHLSRDYSKENEAEIMGWWDRAIEAYNQLGLKYIVIPSMTVNSETTMDDVKLNCDYFTAIGYKTAAAGIALGYHNHDFEFTNKLDGQPVYDIMLNTVSKNHVFFQLDVYWCQEGGYNPVDYLKNHADQIKTVHIKDEKEIGASGRMDFEAIFNQMNANGVKDWYVEVEKYTNNDAPASVKESFDYLAKANYVK